MMHVCLHDSFSVNYACDFAVHQMRSRSSTQRNTPDNRPENNTEEDPHSPLATREGCDIYESEGSRSARAGICGQQPRTGDCRASAS